MIDIDIRKKYNSINQTGRVSAIGSTGTQHDLWPLASIQHLYVYPDYGPNYSTIGHDIYISSSNNGDTQYILIKGLGPNGKYQESIKQLAGQVKTLVDKQFFRVFDALVLGETPTNGIVYVYLDSTVTVGVPSPIGNTQAYIGVGWDNARMCHFTIPFNMKGWLSFYKINLVSVTPPATTPETLSYSLLSRKPGEFFRLRNISLLIAEAGNTVDKQYDLGINKGTHDFPLSPGEDFVIRGQGSDISLPVNFSHVIKLERI